MTYKDRAAEARRLLDATRPGPWRVNFVGDVVDVGGKPVAVPMGDADAALIAAAPGLLEWALGLLDRVRELGQCWADYPTDYDEDTEQSRADGRAILAILDGSE